MEEKEKKTVDQTRQKNNNEKVSGKVTENQNIEENIAHTEPTVEKSGQSEENESSDSNKKKLRSRKGKPDKLADENEALRFQLAEVQDKYLRLFSEFDNYRKRTNKEKVELLNTASATLITDLLPVLDDMERARANFVQSEDLQSFADGILLIFNKFSKILTAKGLAEMESTGKPFDTDLHEAIAQMPAADEKQKNVIIDTTEKGYTIHDKVIRHAKVVVGV